jgi:hypothetical protein
MVIECLETRRKLKMLLKKLEKQSAKGIKKSAKAVNDFGKGIKKELKKKALNKKE